MLEIIDITNKNVTRYKDFMLKQFNNLDWGGSKMLAKKVEDDELQDSEHVILLVDNNSTFIGHGSLLQEDIVKDTNVSPFIAAVFVSPDYRGQGYSLKIVQKIENIALSEGYRQLYIVTNHEGLYEKEGFRQIGEEKNIKGEYMRLLTKKID